MTLKQSIMANVSLDWDRQTETRSDLNAGQWEDGVDKTLRYLYFTPPNTTSRNVMRLYLMTGKKIVITPEKQPFGPEHLGRNASANADDKLTAAGPGLLPEGGGSVLGTGGGSSTRITFTAQDWSTVSQTNQPDIVDEVLLHELIHALRQAMGKEDDATLSAPFERQRRIDNASNYNQLDDKYAQSYQNLEEFIAVLLTNIYRSEKSRIGLIRDHAGDYFLAPPLTNPRNFLTVWRPQIVRMCNEMPMLCNAIASVNCYFNPIFELYAADDRFIPGGRGVKFGADARRFRA